MNQVIQKKQSAGFILNTKFCVIKDSDDLSQLRVFIAMSNGGWIEHNSFENNLQGLVAALDLATQVCAGKFYPKGIVSDSELGTKVERLKLESKGVWG